MVISINFVFFFCYTLSFSVCVSKFRCLLLLRSGKKMKGLHLITVPELGMERTRYGIKIDREIERKRRTNRQTDRQIDRQTDRQIFP